MASIILVAIFFLVLDRFLKFLAVENFINKQVNLLGSIFTFNFTPNYNIAFSLPVSGAWLNFAVGLIILVLIFWLIFLIKKQDLPRAICLAFIILGAVSNLADRINYGFVIDYFDLKYFTVFNLADVMIAGGVIMLLLKIKGDIKN